MKKNVFNIILMTLVMLVLSPSVFAGIPIQEKAGTQDESVVVSQEKTKKVSKLKKRIAKKIAKKLVKEEEVSSNKILAVILAIILPFVGVAVWQNGITKDFWITLLLTFLFYLPGLIYALYIILN
jgi:uncharacterized membrane protein YqaE (UPF0057 family)